MAISMIMPKVDVDQETGTILEWLKSEGQRVEEGETILVIETDKIAIEVESPENGILAGVSAYPGDVIPVGTVIAYILAEGEELPDGVIQPSVTPGPSMTETPVGIEDGQLQDGDQIPLTSMRRSIVEKLNASFLSIPPIQFSGGIDMTEFNKVRTNYNDLITPRGEDRVSVTALLVKLLARTLEDHPLLNSTLQDEVILLHEEINIGLVVALENGLIVPVLKNANQKGIGEIAEESNDLIARARKGKLTSKDIKGATFSISNLGPFGVEQFTAIINPPEVAVLAVGAILPTVVPLEGDKIEVRPLMRFTLSADHRVLDGVIVARFITDLKTRIENPKLENY